MAKRKDGTDNEYGVRRLKAIQFLKERLANKSAAEIGRQYNVDPRTVRKTLTWAEKAKIFVEVEDALIRDLAPLAVDALRSALVEGDSDVALEVLKGLNILKKNHPLTSKEVKEQDDLVHYITQIRSKAELDASTTEGQLLERRPQLQLVPGYSPELLAGRPAVDDGERRVFESMDSSISSDGEGEHPTDAEPIPHRDGVPAPEAAAPEGTDCGQDSVPSPTEPLADGSAQERSGEV
jgi:hypothetical protein